MKNSIFACAFLMTYFISNASDSLEVSQSFYLDSYYSVGIEHQDNANLYGTTGLGRIFYGKNNEFALGMAQGAFDFKYGDVH